MACWGVDVESDAVQPAVALPAASEEVRVRDAIEGGGEAVRSREELDECIW